jgi:cytosine deaminase
MLYTQFMKIARQQAQQNDADGSDSVGAVLVKGDEIIAKSDDQRLKRNNPIATAEMECIRLAGRRTDQTELVLISTRYPDMLLAGTMLQFSIGGLVIGMSETSNPAIRLLKSKNIPVSFLPLNPEALG